MRNTTEGRDRRSWQRPALAPEASAAVHRLAARVRAAEKWGWSIANLPRTDMTQSTGLIITAPDGRNITVLDELYENSFTTAEERVDYMLLQVGWTLPRQ